MFAFLLMVQSFLPLNSESTSLDSTWVPSFKWQSQIAAKTVKTVEDYYLLLPSSIMDCENIAKGLPTIEERKKEIRISDVKNGYLAFFNASQVAVFKNRAEKLDVIAIQSGQSGAGNTCGAVNSVFTFDIAKKTWIKRDDLLPKGYTHVELYQKLSDRDILPYFDLPQKGTEIKIKDENNDSTISILKWNGQCFLLKK